MKKLLWPSVLFVLISILLFKICQRDMPVAPPPTVTVNVLDESLQQFAEGWRMEVARRFPDAVVVLCHGGTFVEGQWLVKANDYELFGMTTDQLAQHYKDKFPNRTIVLLCCNPGHLHLHVHGVWHAMDSVYCVPDRGVGEKPEMDSLMLGRWSSEPGVVGNIFEFVED